MQAAGGGRDGGRNVIQLHHSGCGKTESWWSGAGEEQWEAHLCTAALATDGDRGTEGRQVIWTHMQATEKPRISGLEWASSMVVFTSLGLPSTHSDCLSSPYASASVCCWCCQVKMSLPWSTTRSCPSIVSFPMAHAVCPDCMPPPSAALPLSVACTGNQFTCTASAAQPQCALTKGWWAALLPDIISPHALTTSYVHIRGWDTQPG